jgi:tRNA(Ile)-lysidine synthase
MTFFNRFIEYNKEKNFFQKNDRLLLAVSGGVDSVVLCELCKQANFPFEIAHCNFQLRGEESERDETFARSLAKKYDVKIFVIKFNTKEYATQNKVSIQVAARELRYNWFEELLTAGDQQPNTAGQQQTPDIKHRASYLLTAHHANDNIETLLMNFFKGTGIKGLQGILPRQGNIIRPLLFAKKEEILQFAKENNLSFVEDSSNSSDKYTRNYFRHQLIPAIQKVFPQVQENLLNNIERYREIEVLYSQSVFLHKKKLLEIKGNEIHIPVLKLLKAEPLKTIIYEIIKDYGFTAHQTGEVLSLLKSGSGKYISSSTHKIIRNRDWLIIAPVNTLEAHHIVINEEDKEIDFEEGKLRIKNYELKMEKPPCSDFIATLDADNINFPLLLRRWEQGDYFYPLGMLHKKKLSKFFIDQKLSVNDKEKIWVIESNKKIIWIVGKRIDDRFKITDKTKKILSIELRQ